MAKYRMSILAGLFALTLATPPMFFEIYRTAAFNTAPRDDYAPYLLTLLRIENKVPNAPFAYSTGPALKATLYRGENKIPNAPFAYRPISVAVAIPFYYAVPLYTFSNLTVVDVPYMKATQALCFCSYVCLVLTAFVIYFICKRQFHATEITAFIAGAATFFIDNLIGKHGIDPFVILFICLLILWMNRPLVFALLVLVSIGVNEKIPLIFATVLAFRLMNSMARKRRFTQLFQLGVSCLAVAGYFAVTHLVKVPDKDNQTNPALFLAHIRDALQLTFSSKGLVLNVLPVFVLFLIVGLALKCRRQSGFVVSDLSAIFLLLILGLLADLRYNVGRIVMHAYPLYLPAAACFLDDVLKLKDKS